MPLTAASAGARWRSGSAQKAPPGALGWDAGGVTTAPMSRREVSPLELFYDLVFVFAVSQLSHHLLTHLSWRGAGETAIILVAVCGVWAATSFDVTLLDVTLGRTKLLLVVLMVLGLFMNAGITDAFEGNGWMFVAPLLAILLGHNLVMSRLAPTALLRRHYARSLVWSIGSAPLWVIGAAATHAHRAAWWALAAAIELLGFWLAHPLPGRRLRSEHHDFDVDHMLERLRLFLIILFGETVLTIGRVITQAPLSPATALAALGVLVALLCLWAMYFGGGERLIAAQLGRTADPIRAVRLGANVTYGVLAGLVAVAVGSQLAIADPLGRGSVPLAILLCGGIVVYLGSQAWYFRVVVRAAWAERLAACAAVVFVGLLAVWVAPLIGVLVLDGVLVAAAALLIRVHQRAADDATTRGGNVSHEAR